MTQFSPETQPSPGSDPGPAAGAPQAGPRAAAGGPAPDPRAFLEHMPAHRRSTVANWFHFSARASAPSPAAVCSGVWQTVQRRLEWSSDLTNRQFLQNVLDLLQTHQDEALAYAQHVISYEQLPYAERQKIKGRRALSFVMQGKAPTLPQLAYLRRLGYQGPPPADRSQASVLIDQLRQGKGGGQ